MNATALSRIATGSSGSVVGSYATVGLVFKIHLSAKLMLGLILDASYGADVADPLATNDTTRGSRATLCGDTIVVIGRYKISDQVSVHAGLRSVGIGGSVSLSATLGPGAGGALLNAYSASLAKKRDTGLVIGAAYEKPEITLRGALTYQSQTKHTMMPFRVRSVSGMKHRRRHLGQPVANQQLSQPSKWRNLQHGRGQDLVWCALHRHR